MDIKKGGFKPPFKDKNIFYLLDSAMASVKAAPSNAPP